MTASAFVKTGLSIKGVYIPDVLEILKEFFGMSKEEFFLNPEKEIDESQAMVLLEKLKCEIPSAYIVGHVKFAGIDVKVNPAVLIPRMETEELVLKIIKKHDLSNKRVLDLCTGSGCIGLALKKAFPSSYLTLSDISKEALETAKENTKRNHIKSGVEFVRSDFLDEIDGRFDFVVSNPPYIPTGKKTEAKFEPTLALYSGEDGCDSYRRIFKKLKNTLKEDGEAYFEMGEDEKDKLTEILKAEKFFDFEFIKDLSGKDRFVHVWLKKEI